MKLRPICSAIVLLAALSGAAHAEQVRRSYIVQLVDKPVATYTGQVAGLAATQPAAGQRLNVDAGNVQAYLGYLDTKQNDVINSVSAAQITHKYDVVFNGFAALLTDDEVRALKKNAGVAAITADSEMMLDTSFTPSFLGLDQPGGLWSQLGGQALSGEDIIVGIVDSGVWPENPAYADRVDDQGNPSHSGSRQVYDAPPANWKGGCDTGEGFGVANCNNKLIGARYYKGATQQLHWTEFASARDSLGGSVGEGGHGSHTSTTVAGNASTNAIINGVSLGKITGMAPRARIAAYKVCWTDPTRRSSCATANSVAAINQAVKDGVNVINFSIGPSSGGGAFDEATEQAFLGAAAAGVFVSTSAGNSGPSAAAPAPASHISPWLASVGNSTHNRLYVGDAVLPTGAVLTGASSNANTPSSQLILARDAGVAGLTPAQLTSLNQCFGPADNLAPLLDPAKVAGKILVCDRGNNVLVNKSANAKTAGAVGAIIANVEGGAVTILNQSHSLSTVHITKENGAILKSYIAGNTGATASLGNLHAIVDTTVTAPIMNTSSSRGPNVADANILKPDLTAPGTDILAALTPDLTQAQRDAIAAGNPAQSVEFGFLTGTSMASPHVAGVAALLKQRHPTWSPAAIKSALMTSAYDTYSDGLVAQVPWDTSATYAGNRSFGQGAGHISPNQAADPGLVYDITTVDYLRFLCGQGLLYTTAQCTSIGGGIAAYNLNLASLTAATVLGTQTLTRTVTNVGSSNATYNVTATLPGFSVVVSPATLTLAPGAKATYTAKLTRTTAPLDTWAYGSLTWSDGVHKVRSPLTARGTGLSVASAVYSEKASGSKILTVGSGFAGAFSTTKGLLAATETSRPIAQANIAVDNLALCRAGAAPGVNIHSFTVPSGTLLARFSLFDADNTGTPGVDSDLDLVLLRGTALVGSSGNATSNESVQLVAPAAGTYTLCVIGYQPAGGQAAYKLSSWLVQPTSTAGNFKVLSPGAATIGGTASVGLSWSNLDIGKRYVGAVNYLVGGVKQGTTVIDVDTTDPLPLFKNASNKGQFAY
jgi:subtilisin family serine protease